MKKLLFLLTLAICSVQLSYGGGKDKDAYLVTKDEGGAYCYEAVVTVENATKEEMYARAKKWVMDNLQTGDNNISSDDKEFSIVNNATFTLKPVNGFGWAIPNALLTVKLHLQFKDGKYKIRCDNLSYHITFQSETSIVTRDITYSEMTEHNQKSNKHLRAEADEKLKGLAGALENQIRTGGSSKKEW